MARTVLSPRWLLALVVAAAFAVACVFLGRWQWGKYEDKLLRADAVTTNYSAPAVDLGGLVDRLPLTESGEWTRVTATGTYDAADQLLVRNRVQGGSPGLEVLVPLTLTPGATAGGRHGACWSTGAGCRTPTRQPSSPVPSAPGGTVTVQGWLRRPEPSLGRDLPRGQLASIAIADVEGQIGSPVLPTYLVLESERTGSGATPARPADLEPPDTDLGTNQAYAFQWWLFSAFGFVFYGYRLKVDRQERRDELDGAGSGTDGLDLVATAPRQLVPAGRPAYGADQPAKRAKPVKAKKVRIWDEEDS